MNAIFNVHDAKTHLSKLLDRVRAGEEIIIAKAGTPYAKMVPIPQERPKRQAGRFKGMFTVGDEIFDPLPEDELHLWEGHGD